MSDPEKLLHHDDGEKDGGSGKSKPAKESPLSFLEQVATLFKLRLLRNRLGVEGINADKIMELETKLVGSEEEQIEAESEIKGLFDKILQVDKATFHKVETLEETLEVANIQGSAVNDARRVDGAIAELREKGEDQVKEEDIQPVLDILVKLSDAAGVEIETNKEQVDVVVHKEVAELHRLKDWAQLRNSRKELGELIRKKTKKTKREQRELFLEQEDFKKDRIENKRILRVSRGTKQHQEEADTYISSLQRDFEGDQLERTDEKHLAEGFLESKRQNRRSLRYGDGLEGARNADILTIQAGNIYADRLIDLIVERELRKYLPGSGREPLEIQLRAKALEGVMGAWTSRGKDLTSEQVIERIEQRVRVDEGGASERRTRREQGQRRSAYGNPPDDLDPLEEMGQTSQWGGSMRKGLEKLDELKLAGVDIGREIAAFNEKKQEYARGGRSGKGQRIEFAREFVDDLKARYPNLDDETYRDLFSSVEGMFGNEHYVFLKEKLGNMDYEGYLKYLMSYLYKVGLREGRQDFQLQIMMREARTILATVGRRDLLEIYEAFEKTAIFHDAYFQLDREGYAKILNQWGVEPLQVFKDKEANTLNVKVKTVGSEGAESKDLSDLSVIAFDDMMQSRVWAHRLLYGTKGEIYDADKVYDDMIVTQLYGGSDQVLRVEGEEVKDVVSGEVVARLTDQLLVDGATTPTNLATLLQDSKYMVGTAHDMWRLDGRIANVLDDVQIGAALGANKGLLTVWKIKRYAEEYGFISPYMFEALELDNFIYEVENYKDLVGAGMKELFKGGGGDGAAVAGIVNEHIKRLRILRGEEFRTNYLPIEDVRLLSRQSMTWEEAKAEYLQREALMGNIINWDALSPGDRTAYTEQITNLHSKWQKNLFSADEWRKIKRVNWKMINAEYAKILGVESIGDNFEDFVENFSFGRLSATKKFRGTDLQDYGGYYLKSGAVVDIYKSGLGGGATEAIQKMFGTMEGYLPYDKSGFRRFAMKEMEVMYSWDDRRLSVEIPETDADGRMSGGKMLPNGEIMTDETGQWAHTKERKILLGKSLLEEGRMRKPRTERDIEYATYSMVGSGTLDRAAAEEFLDLKYGGWLKGIKWGGIKIKVKGKDVVLVPGSRPFARMWRWLKRWAWLDDPAIFWEAAWDDGKKVLGSAWKQLFSGI